MLFVECSGTPYEIGFQHGSAARLQIEQCIIFYSNLFRENCKKSWPEVQALAKPFLITATNQWPAYYDEMRGIADGSGREMLDIVVLNVRTEINFGLFSDGCTALAWHTEQRAWLGQNWDWLLAQAPNLIITKITQPSKPTLVQLTEAGIIGKIGFNSSSVGTLLNAIRVHGVDASRLPVHFGLRMALESHSAEEAVKKLQAHGMAASAHILIADAKQSIGLEFTKSTFARCEANEQGQVVHTNHLLREHPGELDTIWLKDSLERVKTMTKNLQSIGDEPSWNQVNALFEDEDHLPCAISRVETPESGSATLFNIVMDLKSRHAVVRVGRPTDVKEIINLDC